MDLARTGLTQQEGIEDALHAHLAYFAGFVREKQAQIAPALTDFSPFAYQDRETLGECLFRNAFHILNLALLAILGFAGGNGIFAGGASTYTADYTPLYTWFPDKVRADRNRWGHVPTISATEMLTGALSATATGDLKYAIEMSIDVEPRYHLYRSAGRTTAEKERCLDTFVWGYGTTVDTGVADGW